MLFLEVRRVGSSAVLTLPQEALDRLRVREGDAVVLTETPEGYRLARCDETFADAMRAFEETRRSYRNAFRELSR